MGDVRVQKEWLKKYWTLSPHAFDKLLAWLDQHSNSEGRKYVEMRRRLVTYFDRKNCPMPDDLADETLNRVARRLEEEGDIKSEAPAKYCYTVARFVFMEHLRQAKKTDALIDDLRRQPPPSQNPGSEADVGKEIKEKMLNCLEQCAGELEPANRELIVRYYVGTGRIKIENRRVLAKELGVTLNALSIRACRIRDRLEDCVRQCVG